MVRSKGPAKKQQKKGIDFKKIKRKLGRKLPPPKNATNTEITSKAIILPEQSVAAEKSGLATSKKGLTLKELLQQTSHHNAKVRKDALHGIKDLFKHHPDELQSHKYTVIQKLRERISDDDKLVREIFLLLFKSEIFPAFKEDNQGSIVSLLMPYIFSAMADSAIDVRLMAFKFFHLVVEYYPPTFSLYAEKILDNYVDIIQKNHFYVQDKGKLKVALSGLAHCLSLLPCDQSSSESQKKEPVQNETLHAYEKDAAKECVQFAHVSGKLKNVVGVLINCFEDFIPLIHAMRAMDALSFDCIHHILRSIGYAIKFSIIRHAQTQAIWRSASEGVTLMILDRDIASMLSKKLLGSFPLNPENHLSGKGDERYFILNSVLTEIFLEVSEWSHLPTDLCDRFLEYVENTLLGKITRSNRLSKSTHENTLLALIPFVPKLILRVDHDWRDNLLQAFTMTFNDCKPDSSLKLACISIIREMIIPNEDILYPTSDPTVNNYQTAWINKLPSLLNQLGDKHLVSSQAVLQLLLHLGKVRYLSASPEFEECIRNFFTPCQEDVSGGPFAALPREVQELALCFLSYFIRDNFSSLMLKSIVSCCLYPHLEPSVLYRIVEILHSVYRAGHIQITDHVSFFITLVACFKVIPEKVQLAMDFDGQETSRGTLRALTALVCSCLSEMGDNSLVLQIVEKVLLEQIILKPSLDNGCAILRMICELDSKPTNLSESSIAILSEFLPGYLIELVNSIPEDKENPYIQTCLYYLVPCFFLFDRSSKLMEQVVRTMRSIVDENSSALASIQDRDSARNSLNMIKCIVSVILLMHNDAKIRKKISSSKSEIHMILQNVISLQSSESGGLTVEGKHMMKIAGERLRIASNSLLA